MKTINVLDAIPGAGKTEYFVARAVEFLKSTDHKTVMLYAAPTVVLLREVQKRIETAYGKPSENVVLLTRPKVAFRGGRSSRNRLPTVSARLNLLLGILTPASHNLLRRTTRKTGQSIEDCIAKPGTIILCTHEAFLRIDRNIPAEYPIPSNNGSGNSGLSKDRYAEYRLRLSLWLDASNKSAMASHANSILSKVNLYFDEARSCLQAQTDFTFCKPDLHRLLESPHCTWRVFGREYNTSLSKESINLLHDALCVATAKKMTDTKLDAFAKAIVDDFVKHNDKTSEAVTPTDARRNYDLAYEEDDYEYAEELSKLYPNRKRKLPRLKSSELLWELAHIADLSTWAVCYHQGSKNNVPADIKKIIKYYHTYCSGGRASLVSLVNMQETLQCSDPKRLDEAVFTKAVTRQEAYEIENAKVGFSVLTTPTRMFDGFGKVTIMSAFFQDSQMYHFLAKEGYEFCFLDSSMKLPPSVLASVKSIEERKAALTNKIQKRLHLAPLISTPRNTLTKSLLSNGILLPNRLADQLSEAFQSQTKVSKEELVDIYYDQVMLEENATLPLKLTEEQNNKIRMLAYPPLLALLKAASKVHHNWENSYGESPMLPITNVHNSATVWQINAKTELDSVRLATTGFFVDGHSNDAVPESLECFAERHPNLEAWGKKFGSKLVRFNKVKLQGLNKFSYLNCFCHLACLNMDPHTSKLITNLLPKYDIDKDNVVDNIVQTLYRTSLRTLSPDSDNDVLAIIPYANLGKVIQEKLGLKKKLPIFHQPTLAEVDLSMSPARKAAVARRVGRANRKYDPEVAKMVNSAKSSINLTNDPSRKSLWQDFLSKLLAAPHDVDAAVSAKAELQVKLAKVRGKA